MSTLSIFNEGVSLYHAKDFEKAKEAFQKVAEMDPGDRTAHFFLGISNQILESGHHETKAGIIEMKEK